MPRPKSFRRAQEDPQRIVMVGRQGAPSASVARRGTGIRHRVEQWPASLLTGRQHKLVIPDDAPGKKLVLLVGDSHLRSFADRHVKLPEGCLSFAVMSTPGACAAQLRTEVLNATVPRTPDLVCLMAPSNNLTASRTVDEGRADFAKLLCAVCTRWPKVIVMDFVPRLVVDEELQAHFRNAFSHVAASMNVPYIHLADNFPTKRLQLWCRDGVHLSDEYGMPVLADLLWNAAYTQLATPPPEPQVPRRTSPRSAVPRRLPRVVVKGKIVAPRQPGPDGWWLVEGRWKRKRPREEESSDAGQRGMPTLRECFIPLNPVRFSSVVLHALERAAPSDLSRPVRTAPPGKKKPRMDCQPKAVTSKRRLARQQVKAVVETAPVEVVVTQRDAPAATESSPPSLADLVVTQREAPAAWVTESSPPSLADLVVTQREAPAAWVTESSPPSLADLVVTQREAPAAWVTESSPPSPVDFVLIQEDFPPLCSPTDVKGRTDIDSPCSGSVSSHTDVTADHEDCTSAEVKWIRGSFHQGDQRFKYPGVQCMPIALASLAEHTVRSVFSWRRRDLDHVLHLGNDLYAFLRENKRIGGSSQILSVPELPGQHVFDGQQFTFDYGSDYVSGVVNVVDGELVEPGFPTSLLHGLERMLGNYSTCLLTMAGTTCAVISQNGRYAVVDSHARSAAGLVSPYGRSIAAYFSCVRDLHEYICNLAASLDTYHTCFEIAGVCVSHIVFADSPAGDADVVVVRDDAPADVVVVSGDATAADADVVLLSGDATAADSDAVVVSGESPVVSGNAPADDADVVFVSDETCKQLQFEPLSKEVAQSVCKRLNVECEKLDEVVSVGVGLLGSPCKKDNIVADGNCFFRAVSLAVSGTQKSHRKLRLAVVKHLEKNASQYNSILRSEYSSVADYVRESKMRYVGSWATEVEIQAAADCLGVDILTFCDGRWLEYSCKFHGLSRQGIYLENCNGNHYETVVCVYEPQLQRCYGLCNVSSSDCKVYDMRRRGTVESCIDAKTHTYSKQFTSEYDLQTNDNNNLNVPSSVVVNSLPTEIAGVHVMETKTNVIGTDAKCNMPVITTQMNEAHPSVNITFEPEIEFVGDISSTQLTFDPLNKEVSQALCKKMNVDFEKSDEPECLLVGKLGKPCKNDKIEADGNSFFRAISLAISGTQKNHRKVRLAVVKHLQTHASVYENTLKSGYSCVSNYIKFSKMNYLGSRATEIEIQATADYLGLSVFTYCGDRWIEYCCNDKLLSKKGIYLNHCSGNHYETVTCVHTPQLHSCYGFCQVKVFNDRRYNMRQHVLKSPLESQLTTTGDSGNTIRYSLSKYLKNKMTNKHYLHNVTYKERKNKLRVAKYHNDPSQRLKENNLFTRRYCHDVLFKEKIKKYSVHQYKVNEEHREYLKNLSKCKYKLNELHREKLKQFNEKKYKHNEKHRHNVKELSTTKYKDNEKHRHNVKELSKTKYKDNEKHRHNVKELSTTKYKDNEKHRHNVKELSKTKYKDNEIHRHNVKELSQSKYKHNVVHKTKVKEFSINKYKHNTVHRDKVKDFSINKYKQDAIHRERVKAISEAKYHGSNEYKLHVASANKVKRLHKKEKQKDFDFVMEQFLDKVEVGPNSVCCVCLRLLFKHQVINCKKHNYNKTTVSGSLAEMCITEEYLHKCNEDCTNPCQWLNSERGQLWICHTCNSKLSKGILPPECSINSLSVDPIPPELACLNSLEQHLIALHIPFMKMLALPKGGQNGVHGPVTCVPANIVQTTNLLPRSNMDSQLLLVKLKRKLTYKGHYEYQYVDTTRIRKAIQYLKQHNVYYADVEFNEDWLNDFCKEQNEKHVETQCDNNVETNEVPTDVVEEELLHDRQKHCMYQDTCLMPVDIGQETLDQYFQDILNIAPAEGNNPVKLLSDQANEAKCFPVLFPQGNSTFHEERANHLTLSRYLNNRILHVDGRFAQDVNYIFYGQYMSEVQQVVSKVSIALRKGRSSGSDKVKESNIRHFQNNEEKLKKWLEFDDGYRFLKPIRGTPAFWQEAQRDLLACVRQLGLPTWFCSFSSADLRWQNLLNTILKQEGRAQTAADLEWADRCELLRRNPVTAARMFDYRWHVFLKEVLMSPSHPIGKIKDYFYRVEFQQRGSPHVHCLFWIENAPIIDKNTDDEVVAFIDKYVTCELPPQNDPLLDTVSSVQQHSKTHSKSCKKKNTTCRFHFPRIPSARTFISRSPAEEDLTFKCKCQDDAPCTCGKRGKHKEERMKKDYAEKILAIIKKEVSEQINSNVTIEALLQSKGINQGVLEAAYNRIAKKTSIVLKRQVTEVWINQYSKPLLKCWNANLDVQFVVDAYACIVYIISYISKSEREIGLLLGNAHREASKDGNISAKEALKTLGSVYLHNRDVCAQEAVYRLTNMHLKECSRKVVFVPTGENIVKISLPLSVLQKISKSPETNTHNIWMKGLVDRYLNRPNDSTFNNMCIATFASEYRILSKNEHCKNRIQLQNDCGFVAKRSKTEPAVIRYARFSETKATELFYHSILQLFLPYRCEEQLKPTKYDTYEDFYKHAHVGLGEDTLHSVKELVDGNRKQFEVNADELDDIQDRIDLEGIAEDAWGALCPEQEVERLESLMEMQETEQFDEGVKENIPDLATSRKQESHLEKRNNIMSRSDGLALIRSLNETQRSVFYQIRQWCLDKVTGRKPEPFHLFVTGGAGTGKSHLIKAIQYEAMRLLSPICSQPDNISVLLTAPTGIAAFHIDATTIHNTFSIGLDVRLPYTPLGEEKVNSLRAKYRDLQILIIDEISMVDNRMLTYVHGRLRQCKQTGDFSPFGNVCVIAVGDFFQLPPVRGKPLYEDAVGANLWSTLFNVVELTEIVRQKDNVFAALLNRIRTRSKDSAMLTSDIEILQNCETGEETTALHIFPTNRQVNEHNDVQLIKACPEYDEVHAQDFVNNKLTGKLELRSGHHTRTHNTCLPEVLLLGKGARVMLCKNVDVMDGLVNGACGTVTDIIFPERNTFPKKVYVRFDDDKVGAKQKNQCLNNTHVAMGSIGIDAVDEKVTNKGGVRRQFPLKLAWACTVHKVQGITVDKAVVSLDKVFAAGQAYVALSRVRSLSGLVIQDMNQKAIYCKDNIKHAIQSMPSYLKEDNIRHELNTSTFNVCLINVQSLRKHISDLVSCIQHLKLNSIAVTETWLPAATDLRTFDINGFALHSHPRSASYNSCIPAMVSLQQQQHGGVGLYVADNMPYDILQIPPFDLECLVCNYVELNILLAVLYRPPSYPMSMFKENLCKLLQWLNTKCNTIAIMGDYNEDILKLSSICKLLHEKGYNQYVTQPTTEKALLCQIVCKAHTLNLFARNYI
ncbi:uncharacterized protein LOC133987667 [Scomber scombrus]|uniref:uncharacterized protein LOC133987667 n=1 Tax=Scomber scombrus TaxID=13677 RepID=UPI002DD86DB3|nr:uncharacterized protein LOC133987667 [Scomber scombrus]